MRKAPDKIYRNTDKTGYVCWSETEFVKPYSATAYIRKDALLEWAKEHQKGEYVGSYNWACYQIFIDKLESL